MKCTGVADLFFKPTGLMSGNARRKIPRMDVGQTPVFARSLVIIGVNINTRLQPLLALECGAGSFEQLTSCACRHVVPRSSQRQGAIRHFRSSLVFRFVRRCDDRAQCFSSEREREQAILISQKCSAVGSDLRPNNKQAHHFVLFQAVCLVCRANLPPTRRFRLSVRVSSPREP